MASPRLFQRKATSKMNRGKEIKGQRERTSAFTLPSFSLLSLSSAVRYALHSKILNRSRGPRKRVFPDSIIVKKGKNL